MVSPAARSKYRRTSCSLRRDGDAGSALADVGLQHDRIGECAIQDELQRCLEALVAAAGMRELQ